MGYCILVVHGLSKLSAGLPRAGAALTVSTLLLLLLFSWKTVKQNEAWLSREALFRSVSLCIFSVATPYVPSVACLFSDTSPTYPLSDLPCMC